MVKGLVEIHKNDMIHRDLKPENIFIDDSKADWLPTAKIGDFGLARLLKNDNAKNPSDQIDSKSMHPTNFSSNQSSPPHPLEPSN